MTIPHGPERKELYVRQCHAWDTLTRLMFEYLLMTRLMPKDETSAAIAKVREAVMALNEFGELVFGADPNEEVDA